LEKRLHADVNRVRGAEIDLGRIWRQKWSHPVLKSSIEVKKCPGEGRSGLERAVYARQIICTRLGQFEGGGLPEMEWNRRTDYKAGTRAWTDPRPIRSHCFSQGKRRRKKGRLSWQREATELGRSHALKPKSEGLVFRHHI